MSAAARLAGFAVLLAAVFGVAALAGGAADSSPRKATASTSGHGVDGMNMNGGHAAMSKAARGLSLSEDGYRLAVEDTNLRAGQRATLRFKILDARGRAVHEFEQEHGAKLHLIIARRDLTGYQHLHPRLGEEGTWSVPLTLPEPGAYRMFADFQTRDSDLTLGADLFVPGDFTPRALPVAAGRATVDGYDVELTERTPGAIHFAVSRGGRELTDLEPYLGARGHLVALRQGDLAYLHVHPEEGPTPGAGISFHAEYPSAGRYRLFLQFKHEGRVHTAEFTREVTG